MAAALLVSQASASYFVGGNSHNTFMVQSEDLNEWTDAGKVGAIIGFGIFFIAYIVTVGMIFFDISWSGHMYEMEIEKDRKRLVEMGLGNKMPELEHELAQRLSGKKEEDLVDNQLMEEAR